MFINFLKRVLWFWSAKRIVLFISYPLLLIFYLNGKPILGLIICLPITFVFTAFRQTYGNIRTVVFRSLAIDSQRKRDAKARSIYQRLNAGEEVENYVLFLRSFIADTQVRARKNPILLDKVFLGTRILYGLKKQNIVSLKSDRRHAWDLGNSDTNDFNEHDQDMSKMYGIYFYAEPGDMDNPNADWFESYKLVFEHASTVFIMPLDCVHGDRTSATFDELTHIFDNNLEEKCIFFMPPEQELEIWSNVYDKTNVSKLWEETKSKLQEMDIQFPEFKNVESGVTIFTYHNKKPVEYHFPFSMLKRLDFFLPYVIKGKQIALDMQRLRKIELDYEEANHTQAD